MEATIHSGNGNSMEIYSVREWGRLYKLIEEACKKYGVDCVEEKLDQLKPPNQECYLLKWECERLAEALERLLKTKKIKEPFRTLFSDFVYFLADAGGIEKEGTFKV
jgi:hypothetical protein